MNCCYFSMVSGGDRKSGRTFATTHFVFFFIVTVWLILTVAVSKTVASCNSEQRSSCRKSAVEDNLDLLASGGQCLVRQYVQFTHICTVTNYLPTTDSCCCVHQNVVMCCRYHQVWNHFRCVETEDTVHRLQEEVRSVQLELLIPLVLLGLLLFFIVILFPASRLLRCQRSSTTNSQFCISAWSPPEAEVNKPPVTGSSSPPADGRHSSSQLVTMSDDTTTMRLQPILESHPSTSSSSTEEGSQTVLIPLVNRTALWRTHPSAPPLSDLECHLANAAENTDAASAMEYHVCHLPINGRADSNSPILLIGCHRTTRETQTPEADDVVVQRSSFRRIAANREIYMAPAHPPSYEEAIGRRTTE